MQLAQSGYPVNLENEPQLTGRNRLTTAFRIILAIPHLFLVGGGVSGGTFNFGQNSDGSTGGFDNLVTLLAAGVLSIAAWFMALLSWFAILFTGKHPRSFWDFEHWVLRWQTRVGGYTGLLRDEYPPFGEGEYGTQMLVEYPDMPRNRLTVFFRFFMLIPHFIVLGFLNIAFGIVTVIAWFAILFTGAYPQGLYEFAVNVFRWNTRVSAYGYLLRDEYPPFSLSA